MEQTVENPRFRIGAIVPGELEGFLPLIESYQRLNSVTEIRRGRNRGFFGRLLAPSQHGAMLGARHGDEPIGFACLKWELDALHARETVRFSDLYIAEPWRRAGVGRSLITSAADLARARGADALICRVRPENLAARAVLEAAGAEPEAAVGYELPL